MTHIPFPEVHPTSEVKHVFPLCKRSDYLFLKEKESRRLAGNGSFEDMAQFTLDAIGDADSLMRNSDTAIYTIKESGRNSYRFFGL